MQEDGDQEPGMNQEELITQLQHDNQMLREERAFLVFKMAELKEAIAELQSSHSSDADFGNGVHMAARMMLYVLRGDAKPGEVE